MKNIKIYLWNKLVTRRLFKRIMERAIAGECIAYNNWMDSLHKNGWPKNPNGTSMDCWELYDYYKNVSGKRNAYLNHAHRLK